MRILSIGSFSGISNTCRFRNNTLKKFADDFDEVNISGPFSFWHKTIYHLFQLGIPINLPEIGNENEIIKSLVKKSNYDIIWIDKGLTVLPSTLKKIKEIHPQTILVNFSPDNMMERPWQSKQYIDCIPLYDYHITTKSFIIDDFYKRNAKNVILVNKTFQTDFHFPRKLNQTEQNILKADIGFVGTWERERCESILYLVDHGLKVRVWGDKEWLKYDNYSTNLTITRGGLYSEDYAKSFSAIKICLCFLKKKAHDGQTARSIEIPACGGFMLAERTEEHKALFKEDKEAVYFSSNEELLEKCRYYLNHDDERKLIAAAGRQRCIDSDYSNEGMIRNVLSIILKRKE